MALVMYKPCRHTIDGSIRLNNAKLFHIPFGLRADSIVKYPATAIFFTAMARKSYRWVDQQGSAPSEPQHAWISFCKVF